MKEIEVNTKMIAACGLYCGACKKYRMGKCPGCHGKAETSISRITVGHEASEQASYF